MTRVLKSQFFGGGPVTAVVRLRNLDLLCDGYPMIPSSRTPEGTPNRCPICGRSVRIEPSSFPTNDAPCPRCGHLLWFAEASTDLVVSVPAHDFGSVRRDMARPARRRTTPGYDEKPFCTFERVEWAVIAALSTMIVCLNDGLIFTTGLWLLGIVAFGQLALPLVFRRVHDFVNRNENLYLGVVVGWGLVPGPVVGVIFGVLLPFIFKCGLSSFTGGVVGLVAGPCFAIIQGVIIVSMVDLIVWILTGTSLSKQAI